MDKTTTDRAPWLRRALLLFVGFTGTAIALSSCFSTDTVECSTGLICPSGYVCTDDGTGCTNTVCGNGVVDTGETCDDGNLIDEDNCPSSLTNLTACQTFRCGDGFIDMEGSGPAETEDCDDKVATTTCDDNCTPASCGDGDLNLAAGEACDNGLGGPTMGASADSDECDRDCSLPTCQDGIANMEHGEQCDNGPDVLDDNCSPTCLIQDCGNSIVDPGEMCDDGNTDNIDDCRNDCLSDNTCGNGVLDDNLPFNRMTPPPGGTCLTAATQDTNCAEVCDDGNNVSGDGCSANCLSEETCRNGITDALGDPTATPPNLPENCDDGNNVEDVPGDLCRNDCQGGAGCGNGLVDPATEQCDDGSGGVQLNSAQCDLDCTAVVCGDGVFNSFREACDPAVGPPAVPNPGVSVAGCDADCTLPACGDGFVNAPAGEFCDNLRSNPTVPIDSASCDGDCSPPRCGDGHTNTVAGEACDNLNNTNTAGCDGNCTLSSCGDGFLNTANGEICDDGNTVNTDGCANSCMPARCGDGFLYTAGGEVCDDGNLVNTDTCTNACEAPRCGDSFVQGTETCDAASLPTATCDLNCTAVACGDGYVNTPAGEQCDDSNAVSGDGCSNTCLVESVTLAVVRNGSGSGTVTSSPSGISCGTDCNESYPPNTVVTLTAAPTALSAFTGWSGGGCSGTGTCVVTLDAAKTVTATFDNNRLTVLKTGNGTGTVTSSPAGIGCGGDCTEDYNAGTVVTLTAAPDANNTFTGWSGAGCSGTADCVVTMTNARTVTATFTLNIHTLTVALAGNGTGTVSSVPTGIACAGDCTEPYNAGTVVTLSATPTANNTFTGWSGACTGTGPCVVTMTTALSVTATFTLNVHQLTVVKAGNGGGTVSSSPAGIGCGTDCTEGYNAGVVVTLSAAPAGNSTFTGWAGGGCSGTGSCLVTMTTAQTVTATFTLNIHTLTVAKTGTGTGTVTSIPAGISCGLDCTEPYNADTAVTLSAAPDVNNTFTGWSGGGCSGTGSCVVTMTAAQTVTASFTINSHLLTVIRAGNGAAIGSVSSLPAGITCGGDCTEPYDANTVVTLTATAGTNNTFTGWSGGGCTGAGTCIVTMTTAQTVTATFTLAVHTLTVAKAGTGAGSVTSIPSGINCGPDCTEPYNANTSVTLVATASAGSQFTGWSGGGCSGAGLCTVTMDAAKTVTATFTLDVFALTVVQVGNGTGTVNSSPAGVACPGDCTETYNANTVVTLTAAATGQSTFTGWSGAGCSGTGTCVVTMDAAKTVTATFVLQTFTLTVAKAGTGTGTVTSTAPGIACGGDCTEVYNAGTVVTLTAAPDANNTFAGWSGACTGTGVCVVTMTAARNVTATFTLIQFSLNVALAGNGLGTVSSSPAGIAPCPGDCSEIYTQNTLVTLTATAGALSTFTGWSGGGCSGTGTCAVTISAATSVTATFTLQTFALTVTLPGNGTGTVSSTPAGIAPCPGDCTETYDANTVVTLTATPGSGSTFTGWGGACSGVGSCIVTMTAARSVTATFTLQTFALTVSLAGGGTGTVGSSPVGIAPCPGDCTEVYNFGTAVTLTATAGGGSVFAGWSGAGCSGTGTCLVTISAATAVTATFNTAAALSITTSSPLSFGTVTQTESSTRTVTVTNTGGSPSSTLSAVGLTGSAAYSVVVIANTCSGVTLAASGSCTFDLLYAPTAVGTDLGTATITATTGGSPSISLTGTSVAALEASQSTVGFGDVTILTTSSPVVVTFTNAGAATTGTITTTAPTGDFAITADTCNGNTVAANATCSVTVQFAPLALGPQSSSFALNATPGGPVTVMLTGSGVP